MHQDTTRNTPRTGWYRAMNRSNGATATLSGEAAAMPRVNLVDLAIYLTWIGIVATIFI